MRKVSTRIHLVKYRHQIRCCKEAVQVQFLGDPAHLSGGSREGVSWYWILCRGDRDGTSLEVPSAQAKYHTRRGVSLAECESRRGPPQ